MRRIKKLTFFILLSIFLTSCGASRNKVVITQKKNFTKNSIKTTPEIQPEDKRVYKVVSNAKTYEGTRYKYGGTTKKGIDCSGLLYVSFLKEDIPLPRNSRAMSLEGERLHLKEVTIGDLLFFETNKNKKVINHVGLVVEVQPNEILFIHSSTSKGVIISSLSETYWYNNFVMARRLI